MKYPCMLKENIFEINAHLKALFSTIVHVSSERNDPK